LNYILADFEFNQAFDFSTNKGGISNPRCPLEIIQIGAIRLDNMFNMTDEFSIYVKPVIYRRLHPFVSKLTGIHSRSLGRAHLFPHIYKNFAKFVGRDSVFLFWGPDDIKELFRNVLFYNLDTNLLPTRYINLQKAASEHLKYSGAVGLRGVVEYFGIPIDRPFHSAVNDAYYVGKILPLIYNEERFQIIDLDIEQLQEKDAKRAQERAARPRPTRRR